MRRGLVTVLLGAMLLAVMAPGWGDEERIPTDAPPFMHGETVMVPARAVFEWLGATVGYEAATRIITARREDTLIRLRVGEDHATVNGEKMPLAAPVTERYQRAYVPLDFAAEALGGEVGEAQKLEHDQTDFFAGEWWVAVLRHEDREGYLVVSGSLDTITVQEVSALGYTRTLAVLLERGADTGERDRGGSTPLHSAAEGGHADAARLLLDHGVDVNATEGLYGNSPLHTAAESGHSEIAALLLDNGAEMSTLSWRDWTPLHLAAMGSPAEIAGDEMGAPSLHLPAMGGHAEIVLLLLDHGADVNAAGPGGMTPLRSAIMRGCTETADLLRERGGVE